MRLLLSLAFLILHSLDAYKILVYSNLFGHSHVKMMGALSDILTDAGHNVTVLIPIIDTNERNRTALKSTKNVIFVEPDEKVVQISGNMKNVLKNVWTDNSNPLHLITRAGPMAELMSAQCEKVMRSKELIELVKNEQFDIGVTEPFDACGYYFFEAINIPAHVSIVSCSRMDHVSEILGQPMATSYVPATQSTYNNKMTIWQRFINTIEAYSGSYMFSYIGDVEYERLGGKYRSWREHLPESSFIFPNQIALLDFPAPTFDKIIPIGGISVSKTNLVLAEKWDKILSLRKTNILISFGSNAKSIHMPEEYKKSLLQVFKTLPEYTFIWKYEDKDAKFAEDLDNVYLGSWLPQNELLGDSRLTVFLTHGGLASTTELAILGKPCIMIPIFADQNRNAEMMKMHGGVEVLHKTDLGNPELLKTTIKKLVENPKYTENAIRLAEMLNNQPNDPRETFVKHVEFAARFGKFPQMDNYGRHLNIFQYYLLDILSIILVFFVAVIYVFVKILKCFCVKKQKIE
ncbi:unnamed protein product [Caenorhabditis angaria]|uniref:glucuronosyltransferase n=1 Tax=Caenorhabditis angaria TaxID=860376 RepID=A0A9P1N4C5_9PELO|nr:unnamed protein product [Caenorhabditis angaria]